MAEAVQGDDEVAVRAWATPRRRRLLRGHAAKLLGELAALSPPEGEAGAVVRREQNYLAGHARRMSYREA